MLYAALTSITAWQLGFIDLNQEYNAHPCPFPSGVSRRPLSAKSECERNVGMKGQAEGQARAVSFALAAYINKVSPSGFR